MYKTYNKYLSFILPITTFIGTCSGVYLSIKHKLYKNGNAFVLMLLGNTYIGIVAGYLYPISIPVLIGYTVSLNNDLQHPMKSIPFINWNYSTVLA